MPEITRRDVVIQGSAVLAGLAIAQASRLAQAFPTRAGEHVLPWSHQPPEKPLPQVFANQLEWEGLGSWLMPNEKFFSVAHYNRPVIDAKAWTLKIEGLVQKPRSFTLDELKARPRQELDFTLECS